MNGVSSINLAPFSFFTGVGSNPPSLVLSVTSASGGKSAKDTLLNVERDRQFVVNSAQKDFAFGVNEASAELSYGESELPRSGLSVVASSVVTVPRLKESAWAFECELIQTVDVGTRGIGGAATLVVGKIVCVHVAEEILQLESKNGWANLEKLRPLARLGGNMYCGVNEKEAFSMDRPKVRGKN